MRKTIAMLCMLVGACGGGDDEIKIERSGPPPQWIKICTEGSWFCTLTWGDCSPGDSTCKVCDPNQPLGQC